VLILLLIVYNCIFSSIVPPTKKKKKIRRAKFFNTYVFVLSLIQILSLQLIDNVPILQIDMVWCYFMIRDIRWLADAGKRLEIARIGIERAHGKDSLRLRLLQGGRFPELAL